MPTITRRPNSSRKTVSVGAAPPLVAACGAACGGMVITPCRSEGSKEGARGGPVWPAVGEITRARSLPGVAGVVEDGGEHVIEIAEVEGLGHVAEGAALER